jgi:hypothetical protein
MVISGEMESWTKEKVFEWLQAECKLPEEQAQKFLAEEINGEALLYLTKQDFMNPPLQLKLGAAVIILQHVQNASGQILLLFAFNRSPSYDDASQRNAVTVLGLLSKAA